MKLEQIMNYAKDSKKHKRNGRGHALKITKVYHDGIPNEIAIDVYKEPFKCNFKNTFYWLPIYIPGAQRLYLVYADQKTGYKVQQQADDKIGRISFKHQDLLYALCKNFEDAKYIYRNWKWDSECARPYVELQKGGN